MYTKIVATAVVSLLLAASAAAEEITVTLNVSTKGLDLSHPKDAHKAYQRLQHAAWLLCTNGNRVGLAPVEDLQGCQQKSIGDAIRQIRAPLLTQIYLQTHTLREAAARGIPSAVEVAAK
jgi:UrcA family protein